MKGGIGLAGTLRPIAETGIHDVFDDYPDQSFAVTDDDELLGYVCLRGREGRTAWVEHILASSRGRGYGKRILETVFHKGYDRLEGTAIYGPHFFWERMGADFHEEVTENELDGTPFVLTRSAFDQRQ